MDARTFEGIKAKIEILKARKAKAEGALENIAATWLAEYKVSTRDEAEALLDELKLKKAALESEVNELYNELGGLVNWGLI
jgi:hypothetical protein